MSRVMPITGALAAAMLTAAPSALEGQDTAWSPWRPSTGVSSDGGSVAVGDTAFIRQAIRGNFLEVGLGRAAESRAEHEAVKDFAERMISEHNSMNQQWGALARNNRMKISPVELDEADRETVNRLEDLDDDEFDRAYMTEMIRLHEMDLYNFQRMASSARSTEVRQLAGTGANSVRQHLALARQVGSQVGVSTTAGRTGGVATPVPTRPVPPTPYDTTRNRTTTAGRTNDDARDDRNPRDDRPPLPEEDREFVEEVMTDHLLHIRLAKRAQREARRDDVREFAERVERTFTQYGRRWSNLAVRRDVEFDKQLEQVDRKKLQRLDDATKRGVDRTYAAIVANHLEKVVKNFVEEAEDAKSPGVRGLVEVELPVLRDLMTDARRLRNKTQG